MSELYTKSSIKNDPPKKSGTYCVMKAAKNEIENDVYMNLYYNQENTKFNSCDIEVDSWFKKLSSERDSLREIIVFSNANDETIDYKKKYFFHHWTKTSPSTALVENEEGELLEVQQEGNFNFKI